MRRIGKKKISDILDDKGLDKHSVTMINLERKTVVHLEKIASQYTLRKVIFRGVVTGIATSFGALLGIIILVLFISKLISNLKEVPLVDDIVRQSRLDVIIESELNRLSGDSAGNSSNSVLKYFSYNSELLGLKFEFPETLSIASEHLDGDYFELKFEGSGYLRSFEIYKNSDKKIEGDYFDFKVKNENLLPTQMKVYESGGEVDGVTYDTPIYIMEIYKTDTKYQLVGFGDKNFPAKGREIFVNIIESIE